MLLGEETKLINDRSNTLTKNLKINNLINIIFGDIKEETYKEVNSECGDYHYESINPFVLVVLHIIFCDELFLIIFWCSKFVFPSSM